MHNNILNFLNCSNNFPVSKCQQSCWLSMPSFKKIILKKNKQYFSIEGLMWGQILINVKLAWITDLHYSIGFHKMGWDKIIDILDFYIEYLFIWNLFEAVSGQVDPKHYTIESFSWHESTLRSCRVYQLHHVQVINLGVSSKKDAAYFPTLSTQRKCHHAFLLFMSGWKCLHPRDFLGLVFWSLMCYKMCIVMKNECMSVAQYKSNFSIYVSAQNTCKK